MDTKHIQIRDYDYPLPDERIAKFPLPERDSSKLLVYDGGRISQTTFRSLPSLLPEGALMVFNNTRVIQARLHFRKESGALIEIFLLEPAEPAEYQENFARRGKCSWYCLVGNLKKWKEGALKREFTIHNSSQSSGAGGTQLTIHNSSQSSGAGGTQLTITATRKGTHGTSQLIEFEWSASPVPSQGGGNGDRTPSPLERAGERFFTFSEVIEAAGELPIPPYLNRKTQESDKTTYQTVYSKIKGSVAAPTAGLHFTERVLADIDARGIEREEVTLHVGAGTFRPVKSENIGGHDMHSEHIAVHRRTIERLLAHGGEAIAVGTTSVRTLESLYYLGVLASPTPSQGGVLHVPQWMPYEYDNRLSTTEALEALLRYMDEQGEEVLHATTQIIIAPGYKYHIVRRMITNFHQPQSTLLLLVSAFIGDGWHDVYDYALANDFRFLSYGDSSLLIP
jgi:S-adenosylmethionine:tRNA ribosyltransferase-isomerase